MKISFKNKGEIKTFSDIQKLKGKKKLKEFITNRSTQKEMLKEVLRAKGKNQ